MTEGGKATSGAPGAGAPATARLTCRVERLLTARLGRALSGIGPLIDLTSLLPGKMLRTRLAARLVEEGNCPADPEAVEYGCAATELVHTASLCHDDVIDGALIRRSAPALWRKTGCSAAVLIGDMLLSEAIDLVAAADGGRYLRLFVAKVKETCAAEAEQELVLRGQAVNEAACLRLARGKTGALFAFIGQVCGGRQADLASALEEAGYRVGAAYQIADDLLDVTGGEKACGKTLGTDTARGKFTLACLPEEDFAAPRRHVLGLCRSAVAGLESWPAAQTALVGFLRQDVQALLAKQGLHLDLAGTG